MSDIFYPRLHYFEEAFAAYYQPLCVFAADLLKDKTQAEDIVQSLFSRIWMQEIDLKKKDNPGAYLYTSVRHAVLNHIRDYNRSFQKEALYQRSMDHLEASAEEAYLRSETIRLLELAMQGLPQGSREVLRLYFGEGYDIQQVSRILGLHPSTVKTQKTRGILYLRKKMALLSRILPSLLMEFLFFFWNL